jgi:hypothetical protein
MSDPRHSGSPSGWPWGDFLADSLDAGSRFPQARATPRYPLVAEAEIYEPLSRTRAEARTTEIGARGCFLEMAKPLARSAIVELRIVRNRQEFRAWARVAYVTESVGVGLAFLGMLPIHRQTIMDWIRELNP